MKATNWGKLFLLALTNHNLTLLWLGQLVSLLGDWTLFVALPIWVYQLTGSALALGGTFFFAALPGLLLGPIAGVLVDRWDYRRTMIVCDLLRGLLVCTLFTIRSASQLWILYTMAAAMSAVSAFFNPARRACLPGIVGEEELLAANSLFATTDAAARLLGPSLGGALVALVGVRAVFWLDAGSFLFSALAIGLMRLAPRVVSPRPLSPLSIYRDLLAGFRLVRYNPPVLAVFAVWLTTMLGSGAMNALYVIFIVEALNAPAEAFGALMTAQALGMIGGGILLGSLPLHTSPLRLLLLAQLLSGSLLIVVANSSSLYLVLALTVLVGITAAIKSVTSETVIQTRTDKAFQGQVFGTLGALISAANLVSMGGAGLLGEWLNIRLIFNLAALVILSGPLIVGMGLRSLREKWAVQ